VKILDEQLRSKKRVATKLESVQPVLMSRDVVRSVEFYARLGFTLAGQDDADNPKYARIRRDDIELHLQWHDAKEWEYPNDRPSYRFVVSDVDAIYERFNGAYRRYRDKRDAMGHARISFTRPGHERFAVLSVAVGEARKIRKMRQIVI